jgi:hypothetical protein
MPVMTTWLGRVEICKVGYQLKKNKGISQASVSLPRFLEKYRCKLRKVVSKLVVIRLGSRLKK